MSNEESKHLYEGLKSSYGDDKVSLTIMSGLKHMDAGFYTDNNLSLVFREIKSFFNK